MLLVTIESLNVYFNHNKKGIQCGGSGDKTFRIRPSLIFTKKHADIFLDRLDKVLVSFKWKILFLKKQVDFC